MIKDSSNENNLKIMTQRGYNQIKSEEILLTNLNNYFKYG